MVNMEETKINMMNAARTIARPAYEYILADTMSKEMKEFERKE
jgi:hypothetical protein